MGNVVTQGGLFGLLRIETLRDDLRKTQAGRKLVSLDETKDSFDDLYLPCFIVALLVIGFASFQLLAVCDVSKDTNQAITFFVAIIGGIYTTWAIDKGVKIQFEEIDAEIKTIRKENPTEDEIMKEIRTIQYGEDDVPIS